MIPDHQPTQVSRGPVEAATHVPTNALGRLFERRFAEEGSPCRSYSELERRSGVSRESVSRYVSGRRARYRSPTVATLVALARAVDLPLEVLCRAALLSGPVARDHHQVASRRAEEAAPLLDRLTEAQFLAFVAFLRHLLADD